MPEGTTELPVIATLIGPRIVPDAQAIPPLVHTAVSDRHRLGLAEVAYAKGHDQAKAYLVADLAKFPDLERQLGVARGVIRDAPLGEDLYSAWGLPQE